MATKKKLVIKNRRTPIVVKRIEFGDGLIQHYKFDIGPYGEVNVVESDLEDRDAFIQSNIENAGAYNFIRKEMANGKSLDVIIAEGQQNLNHQLFADVSNLQGLTPSEVEAKIAEGIADVQKVAQKLGITPDEYLKLTPDQLDALIKKTVEESVKTPTETDGGKE